MNPDGFDNKFRKQRTIQLFICTIIYNIYRYTVGIYFLFYNVAEQMRLYITEHLYIL